LIFLGINPGRLIKSIEGIGFGTGFYIGDPSISAERVAMPHMAEIVCLKSSAFVRRSTFAGRKMP
jgi:hypothetical protein